MALTSTMSALTRDKFMPILVDNIFNSNVLCHKLLRNADILDGGAKIVVPIEYAVNDLTNNTEFITYGGAGSAVSAGTGQHIVDIASKSEWDWATAYSSIVLNNNDVAMNAGANGVLNILKARMQNAEKSIRHLFGTGLFASVGGTTAGLTTLNGAGSVASANNTAHTIDGDADTFSAPCEVDNAVCGALRKLGGIDDSATGEEFWRAKIGSFATISATDTTACTFDEFTTTTNGVADGVQKMTRMYGECSIDNDQPDLIVTTQVIYDAYESSLQANKRFDGDASLGDAGFQSLRFKGASVVVDSHCPDGHMYFLNTKYLDFKVHGGRNFELDSFKNLEAHDAIQARIFWMGQLVCSAPRMQGLLVGGMTSY